LDKLGDIKTKFDDIVNVIKETIEKHTDLGTATTTMIDGMITDYDRLIEKIKEYKKEQFDITKMSPDNIKSSDIKEVKNVNELYRIQPTQPTKQIGGTSFTDTIKLQWEKLKDFMSKDDYLFPYNNVLLKQIFTKIS